VTARDKTMKKTQLMFAALLLAPLLSGCGGLKTLKVNDFTDTRVGDLSLTKKVTGKRDFLFFSTAKMGIFLEGNIQGVITDYQGNPIEGVTVRAQPDSGKSKAGGAEAADEFAAAEENASAVINAGTGTPASTALATTRRHDAWHRSITPVKYSSSNRLLSSGLLANATLILPRNALRMMQPARHIMAISP